MKKSLSLILALTLCLGCIFALASCGGEEKDIYAIAAELAPTKTVTSVDYTAANGDELGGWYTLEIDGVKSRFTYEYKRYRTSAEAIADNNSDPIKTVEGVLYCNDGKVSEDGINWTSTPTPTTIALNLTADKLTAATISEDGKTLTATLTKENAVAVLGTDLSIADGDTLSLTVKSNGTYLTELLITCTTAEGAAVRVRTTYSYNKLTLEFPEA